MPCVEALSREEPVFLRDDGSFVWEATETDAPIILRAHKVPGGPTVERRIQFRAGGTERVEIELP